MTHTSRLTITLFVFFAVLSSCSSTTTTSTINPGTVLPGTHVTKNGVHLQLSGTPIAIGQKLPATNLVNSISMASTDLGTYQGKVLFLSIVPSIDTKVCEAQTHFLGEEGDSLPASITRITISRDTPFAHQRFAQEANLEDITYLSDYKEGHFGRSTGLLMEGPMLLARSVIIVDKQGVVRYIQVVPEITELPDMEKAFSIAVELDRQ